MYTKMVHFDENNRPTPEYLSRVSEGIIRGSDRKIPEVEEGEIEVW